MPEPDGPHKQIVRPETVSIIATHSIRKSYHGYIDVNLVATGNSAFTVLGSTVIRSSPGCCFSDCTTNVVCMTFTRFKNRKEGKTVLTKLHIFSYLHPKFLYFMYHISGPTK
ncbi:unnamed protein product [Gongylonema pulchrum]|uniref:Pectin lyase-like superfamily protein n=1 Tax=Gongylonema pulchrum TaxID=637853 RepID=A0A183CX02_9BILA|nr:unnamed protein product [Gongylonema pulchrum]